MRRTATTIANLMQIIVISINDKRLHTMRRMFPNARLFEGVSGCGKDNYREVCIPKTYQALEEKAVAENWGRETIIFQDDVLLSMGEKGLARHNDRFDTQLLIYGTTEKDGNVAPKGFSATPGIHAQLAAAWDGTGRIVPAWMPIVRQYGLVLDLLTNLSGRNAPCSNCP